MPLRNSEEPLDPRERYVLYRLCDCPTCEGFGKVYVGALNRAERCTDCRGEGRIRQEVATASSPEAVGVALVTLAREGEFEECPLGLLDRMPDCLECGGFGRVPARRVIASTESVPCPECNGSGVKPTGTWLIRPWLPSARNVSDAARTLARSKKRDDIAVIRAELKGLGQEAYGAEIPETSGTAAALRRLDKLEQES